MTAVVERMFGTEVLVAGLPPAAQVEAFSALRRVERVFSRFRPDSDTSRVNAAGGARVPVSPLFAAVLEQACAHAVHTDGVFSPLLGVEVDSIGYDRTFGQVEGSPARPLPPVGPAPEAMIDHDACTVRLPPDVRVDLGGFVKGWAVGRVAEELRAAGVARGLIDAGGDVAAWHEPGDRAWRVAVARPGADGPLATIGIGPRGTVATSSTLRRSWTGADGTRRHHVIDPRTGRPADSGLVQVTVAAPDLADAEVAATCLLVLGPDADVGDLEWIAVDVIGRVRLRPGQQTFVGCAR